MSQSNRINSHDTPSNLVSLFLNLPCKPIHHFRIDPAPGWLLDCLTYSPERKPEPSLDMLETSLSTMNGPHLRQENEIQLQHWIWFQTWGLIQVNFGTGWINPRTREQFIIISNYFQRHAVRPQLYFWSGVNSPLFYILKDTLECIMPLFKRSAGYVDINLYIPHAPCSPLIYKYFLLFN